MKSPRTFIRRPSRKQFAAMDWKAKDATAWAEYNKAWKDNHKGELLAYHRKYVAERRLAALAILSGAQSPFCVRCHEMELCTLQIDHVEAIGKFRSGSTTLYGRIIRAYVECREDYLIQFQVLCASCNMRKRAEQSEVAGRLHDGPDRPPDPEDKECNTGVSNYFDYLADLRSSRDECEDNLETAIYRPGILGVAYRTRIENDDDQE
jgi:hypothetical protein